MPEFLARLTRLAISLRWEIEVPPPEANGRSAWATGRQLGRNGFCYLIPATLR